MKKFNVGDIVFVEEYNYKNGEKGNNHSFVIINKEQAVDINYFGFLLSSKLNKSNYLYNEKLNKNKINNLYQDSIVKCDDLIQIFEEQIRFKIGSVTKNELHKFIQTYNKYLNEKLILNL